MVGDDISKTWRIGPHEVLAAPGHGPAPIGFGLALAAQALLPGAHGPSLLWVREGAAMTETGEAYGPGLASFGLSPDRLVIAEMRTQADALRAALEGARCAALGALVLESAGPVGLTATRRLKLAAEKSGVVIVLVRPNPRFVSNAAPVRWQVAAAPRMAQSGARTIFEVDLLKHPMGLAGKKCVVEWDHERQCFAETLSLPVAAVSRIGPLAR
jgi:protein ImuA